MMSGKDFSFSFGSVCKCACIFLPSLSNITGWKADQLTVTPPPDSTQPTALKVERSQRKSNPPGRSSSFADQRFATPCCDSTGSTRISYKPPIDPDNNIYQHHQNGIISGSVISWERCRPTWGQLSDPAEDKAVLFPNDGQRQHLLAAPRHKVPGRAFYLLLLNVEKFCFFAQGSFKSEPRAWAKGSEWNVGHLLNLLPFNQLF